MKRKILLKSYSIGRTTFINISKANNNIKRM